MLCVHVEEACLSIGVRDAAPLTTLQACKGWYEQCGVPHTGGAHTGFSSMSGIAGRQLQ